eukprot:m.298123 g.298123  ORF g.298123 m.298123 type:complete len:330 (-) comp19534_c9_seq1:116-1105(-)
MSKRGREEGKQGGDEGDDCSTHLDCGVAVSNPRLDKLVVDHLYHFGLHSNEPLKEMFGDVRVVCMGGSPLRMAAVAREAVGELGIETPTGMSICDISRTDRFALHKVGPMLSVSHGMGQPSMSIMLHEVAKLLHYAKASDVVFIRIGTSGGVGVEPGTVVISDKVVNGLLEPYHRCAVLGREEKRPTILDEGLRAALVAHTPKDIPVEVGTTMCCDDFYEAQGRLDGAICGFTSQAKMAFLQRAHEAGVKNMEMESSVFAAFCNKLSIRCAVVCAIILNRLDGDQLTASKEQLAEYSLRSRKIVYSFIRSHTGRQQPAKRARTDAAAAE